MSVDGVNPTDWNYAQDLIQDSRRSASEARENAEEEIERVETARDREIAEQTKAHREELRDQEADYSEAMGDLRETQTDRLQEQRELAKLEIEDLNRRTYDRTGKLNSEADQAKDELKNAEKAFQENLAMQERITESLEDSLRKDMGMMNEEHASELEKTARVSRDSANEAFNNLKRNEKEEYDSALKDLRTSYGEQTRSLTQNIDSQRKELRNSIEQSKLDYERRLANEKLGDDRKIDSLNLKFARRTEDAIRAAQKSRDRETRSLREDLANLVFEKNEKQAEEAANRQKLIGDVRKEWLDVQDSIEHAHEVEVARLKAENEETEFYLSRLQDKALKDNALQNAKLMRKVRTEANNEQAQMATAYERQLDQLQDQLKRQDQFASARLEKQLEIGQEQRAKALKHQAESANDSFGRQRDDYETRLKEATKALREIRTTSDSTKVSPAAENKIRDVVIKKYQALADEETARNRRTVDSGNRNHQRIVSEIVDDSHRKQARTLQEHSALRDSDRAKFVSHVQDVEHLSQTRTQRQSEGHEREVNRLSKSQAQRLLQQRRQYEDIIQQIKIASENRIRNMTQERNFQEKLTHRKFNEDLNRAISRYQKIILDQKDEFETTLANQQYESEKKLNQLQSERAREIAEQSKNFDRRMIQLQAQEEERERLVADSYEKQLDNLRRANARIIRTKS